MMVFGSLPGAGRGVWLGLAAAVAMAVNVPALAQMSTGDPSAPVYAEPVGPESYDGGIVYPPAQDGGYPPAQDGTIPALPPYAPPPASVPPIPSEGAGSPVAAPQGGATYREDDLIGAAEGVFGKGAEGLAKLIQNLLAEQGEPNAYIVGREASGAFIFGVRYGSGTLYHKVEGQRPVYWTGPSVGFDAGANAGNTFVLVYNLHDSQDLYRRFPAGEGQAYLIGGLHASYMRSGDVVLIPIRMGVGLRLGVNAGYMKFTDDQKWIPF